MPKKQFQGFVLPIALVLVALLAVGALTFFLLKNKKIPNIPSLKPSGQTENNQIPDGWLTYENPTYHYKISYPPQFHAQGKNEPPYPPPPTGMSFTKKWDNGEWCDFAILVAPGVNGFEAEIESIRKEAKEVETTTTLAGLPTSIFDAQGGDAINKTYYLTKGTTQYRFGYNYRPAAKYSQECADVVTKMVSSFKFE